ncbi:MAG: hypothetical protein LBV61_10990 [Burkholderiaceae bacterium]|nr:hypothetical protein [Burkholderiaceae bacterium]
MAHVGPLNRPTSAQPEGQRPFRAVCGVATLAIAPAGDRQALRLASPPEKGSA